MTKNEPKGEAQPNRPDEKTTECLTHQEDHAAVLEQVASGLSHDIRTPIRHITHFLDFFIQELGEPLTEPAKQNLSFLRQSVDSANEMIDTLIAFARLDYPRPEWERLELKELIADAMTHTRLSMNATSTSLSVQGTGHVHGARKLLTSLFAYLFENSIMFCDAGIRPEISVMIQNADDGMLVLDINDNGPGIRGSSVAAFRLFQNGVRGRDFQGDGCGLAFARRIAEIHGGTLVLEAANGPMGGAHFRLQLPAA